MRSKRGLTHEPRVDEKGEGMTEHHILDMRSSLLCCREEGCKVRVYLCDHIVERIHALEGAWVQVKALTGKKFSDRMYHAIKSRMEIAEAEVEACHALMNEAYDARNNFHGGDMTRAVEKMGRHFEKKRLEAQAALDKSNG